MEEKLHTRKNNQQADTIKRNQILPPFSSPFQTKMLFFLTPNSFYPSTIEIAAVKKFLSLGNDADRL